MARFARIDSQIRANRLILVNRFRVQGVFAEKGLVFTVMGPRNPPPIYRENEPPFSAKTPWSPNRTPFWGESPFGGLKITNHRFEVIRANRLHVMKIVFCCRTLKST